MLYIKNMNYGSLAVANHRTMTAIGAVTLRSTLSAINTARRLRGGFGVTAAQAAQIIR
jgi:hypothetical protein